jgi:hypothetical protein
MCARARQHAPSGALGWIKLPALLTDRQELVALGKMGIAPSKAWERGIPCERMKPFVGIQLVKVQSG